MSDIAEVELKPEYMLLKDDDFSRRVLVDALLNDQSYHIEFNGHLTNHNKHAVVALYGLGASKERIKSYYDAYAALTPYGYSLEPIKASKHVITQDNWKLYLGKRTSFSSYYQFFDQQEKELGMNKLLNQYVPVLLAGWVGSLTHGAIHLGWGLDVDNRCMIIEGLAYMAFSYVSCHPERASSTQYNAGSVLDSLFHIADVLESDALSFKDWVEELITEKACNKDKNVHPELVRSGLQYRVATLLEEGHPLIYATPQWLNTDDISNIWQQLHYAITLLYMAQPGDFMMLHLLTSLHGMEYMADCMPTEQQRYTIKCFWVGMLCFIFSRGEFPKQTVLAALNLKYKNAVDPVIVSTGECGWTKIIDRALEEEEEHNPKMVYVLRRMWKISSYHSIFRIAASYFTTTPELPKSFEMPPTE